MRAKKIIPVKKRIVFIATLSFLVLLAGSCKKDTGQAPNDNLTQTQIVNEWIYDGMRSLYLWNSTIPSGLDPMTETDSKAFFHKMLNTAKDHFSYITDDYNGLVAELQGEPKSMGYSPGFVRYGSTNTVGIFVEFVYPGSPAARAGLKRGDIILSIDGQTLKTDNYYDLYSQDTYTAGLGDFSTGELKANGRSLNLSAEVISADPVLYDTIFDFNGVKTGYLVYTEFTPGTGNQYINELGNVFDNFKSQGTHDILIDLRYNRGGSIDVAQFLASCLAPASVVADKAVLVKNQYNQSVNNYLVSTEGADSKSLVIKFNDNGHNMDLSRVYFITSWGTASASELVITGLEPYMDVYTIGDTTVGKYTGMWVIPDTNDPPRHNWAMMPIVLKYANADGFTDFEYGLPPYIYVRDDLKTAVPFGDLSDPMLARALSVINGTPVPTIEKKGTAGAPLQHLRPGPEDIKNNLFVPANKSLMDRMVNDRDAGPSKP